MVTGTFAHDPSDELLNVQIEGEPEPIGCTPNHPFWSETREDFVQAIDLEPGEELWTSEYGIVEVQSITARSQSERVYNLEVQTEHVYQVGESGVLVHNAKSYLNNISPKNWKRIFGKKSPGALGREGEATASRITGVPKNTQKYNVNGRNRIPDQVRSSSVSTKRPNHVVEVKNVKRQSYTRQLKDDVDLVGANGQVEVFVRPDTKISKPLQKAFDDPRNPLVKRLLEEP